MPKDAPNKTKPMSPDELISSLHHLREGLLMVAGELEHLRINRRDAGDSMRRMSAHAGEIMEAAIVLLRARK